MDSYLLKRKEWKYINKDGREEQNSSNDSQCNAISQIRKKHGDTCWKIHVSHVQPSLLNC